MRRVALRRHPSARLVAALAAPVLLAGCASGPSAEGGFVGGDGSLTVVPVAEREPAPQVTGELLGGGSFDSAEHAGKVIVYNVWGSWCAPCRKQAPALQAAARATADDAQFVGINTRDLDPAPAQAFVRAFDITFPSVFDPDGNRIEITV